MSDDGCRKCGESGHFARECPNGGGGDNKCRKCNEEGHMAKDCSIPDKCMKCKEEGHLARDCELPDKCRNCGEEGHISRDCQAPVLCKRCGEEGHKVSECTQEEKTREVVGEDGEVREIYVPKYTNDEDLFNSHVTSGINFGKYDYIPVDVKGDKIPAPITEFTNLRPLLMDNINKSNYKKPTPVQKNAIPIILAKRDLMACAQTGSGKTAAFLLPIVHALLESNAYHNPGSSCQAPQAVIIGPTRELAMQINDQARKFAKGSQLRAVVAYGGTSVAYQRRDLERGCNILVATPGRLLDFVEKGCVDFSNVSYFVLDEADRMLDMGFGPDIDKCIEHPSMPSKENRTTLMFSATFAKDVQDKARNYMKKDKIFLSIGLVGGTCSDVEQVFIETDKKSKKSKLTALFDDPERDPTHKVMIFVNTKKTADFLASSLCTSDHPATSIHGDRKQREREEALYDFKSGKRPILVATAVAARGLDIPEVHHVINYELPNDVDEYVHRIGRTGRVGNLGKATSFFDPEYDSEIAGKLEELLSKCGVGLPEFMTGGGGMSAGGDGGAAAGGDDDDEWD